MNQTALAKCGEFLQKTAYTGNTYGNLIYSALAAITQISLLLTLFYRRRLLRSSSKAISPNSISTHLLPVHILYIRIVVVIYFINAIVVNIPGLSDTVRPAAHPYDHDADDVLPCIVKGIIWGLEHLCIDGVAVLLVQPGIGKRAIWTSLVWTIPWAVFTGIYGAFTCYYYNSTYLNLLYSVLHLSIYLIVGFSKCTCLPCRQKRPAFRTYALSWIVLQSFNIITNMIGFFGLNNEIPNGLASTCLNFTFVSTCFVVAVPMFVFTAFRQDSKYWYGHAFSFVRTQHNNQRAKRYSRYARKEEGKEEEEGNKKEEELLYSSSSLSSSNLRKDESVRSTASVDSVLAGYGQQSNNDIRRPLLGLTLPNHAVEHIRNGIETLNRDDVISFAELSIHVG